MIITFEGKQFERICLIPKVTIYDSISSLASNSILEENIFSRFFRIRRLLLVLRV